MPGPGAPSPTTKVLSRLELARLRGDGEVLADAWVGFGQPGGLALRLDRTLLHEGAEVTGLRLGSAADLRGKTLVLSVSARADNPATLRCGGGLRLRLGERAQELVIEDVAEQPGQELVLSLLVELA